MVKKLFFLKLKENEDSIDLKLNLYVKRVFQFYSNESNLICDSKQGLKSLKFDLILCFN